MTKLTSNETLERCGDLIQDVTARMSRVQAADEAGDHHRARGEAVALKRILSALVRRVRNERWPRPGDSVYATIEQEEGGKTSWQHISGRVTTADELGNVGVEFESFDNRQLTNEHVEYVAKHYAGKTFNIHITKMEWVDMSEEWTIDLPKPKSGVCVAGTKIGDQVTPYHLTACGPSTVVAVHSDGTCSLEHKTAGRILKREDGRELVELCGTSEEFVTMHCRARPEILADGRRRFIVMDPAEYQK